MESQQADLLVRILSGGQSDRYYPVWTYLALVLDVILTL